MEQVSTFTIDRITGSSTRVISAIIMKKVLFYINFDNSYTGGPRVVYNFLCKIDQRHFDPLVITNKKSELTDQLDSSRFNYVIVPQNSRIGEDDGEAVNGSYFKRLQSAIYTLAYNYKIAKIIKKQNCDLLWVRNIKGVLLTGFAAKWSKVPLIWDIGMEKPSHGFMYILHNIGFMLSTKVIIEADCVAKSIFKDRQINKNRLKLKVIKSGIPDNRVAEIETARRSKPSNSDIIQIVNIATVCRRKNQAMIIRALSPLVKRHKNIRVLFVGAFQEESYVDELKLKIANDNAAEYFDFLGWRNDATDILVESDIFVLTSYIEGVPYSILEAMHARIPVVATKCGGVPDVLKNDKTGYLVENDDDQAFIEAIETIISDLNKAQTLTVNAAKFVEENYTCEKWHEEYMNLFRNLL